MPADLSAAYEDVVPRLVAGGGTQGVTVTLIIPSSEDPDGLKHTVLARLQSYGLAEEISSRLESSSWALTP